jgi:hypothetical protein
VNMARRCRAVLAWALAIGAIGCESEGSIDLLPLGAGAGAGADSGVSADSSVSCAPAPPGKPDPMGPAPMMPKGMTPAAMPACDDGAPCPPMMSACDGGGPCPPMMPACAMAPDASLLDGPAVTP